ncbi:MAG: hypothetical protein FWB91_04810 [Defluviitaleaceae bacterium]|nr:hypothetical protein [Defluviitaleaceae bacterium]
MSNESLLFLIGTIILTGVTLFLGVKFLYSRKKVGSTTGTIIDIMETAGKHFASQSVALMGYTIDGKYYTSKNRIGVLRNSKVGDEFEVKYFVNNPELLSTTKFIQVIGFFVATAICASVFVYLQFLG